MSDRKGKFPRYICYLSFGKVNNLFAQIGDYVQSHVKETKALQVDAKGSASVPSIFGLLRAGLDFGGRRGRELVVEGEIDPVQKLQRVIDRYEKENLLGDLNESLATGKVEPGTTCFSYEGTFSCLDFEEEARFLGVNDDYLKEQRKETSYSPIHKISGLRTTGGMSVMRSKCCGYVIFLACSMKYFSDMGGGRVTTGKEYSEQDLVDIHPHSGNYLFFEGKYEAQFEAILFLTGQKGKELYGSPLALINTFSPNLTI